MQCTVMAFPFISWKTVTLLAEPFVSNERLCGNHVNFLLSMRKVLLWPIFKAGFAHAHHTPGESFLDTSMKKVSCPSSKEIMFLEKDK